MPKKRRKKEHCPNCGKGLEKWMEYCPKCGQENHIKRASIKLITKDFLKDYWTFDSKLFRSLIPLLFKPGFLTKEFIEGKRQRYIPPVRLYIFVSFVFFLISSWISNEKNLSDYRLIGSLKDRQAGLFIDTLIGPYGDTLFNQYQTNVTVDTNSQAVDSIFLFGLQKKIDQLYTFEGRKKLQKNLKRKTPIFLFILIPLLALLLHWFCYKKDYFYVDHLVYALHLQSFIFIVLLFFNMMDHFIDIPFRKIIQLLILTTYITIAGKKAFSFTYLGSFFRQLGVGITYFILAMIFFLVTVLVFTFLIL